MGKVTRVQASAGILARAKILFQQASERFPDILLEVAKENGIELDQETDPGSSKSVAANICRCVTHAVVIDKDTLNPTITLAARSEHETVSSICAHAQPKPSWPKAVSLIEDFGKALNARINFEKIEVHPHVILDTAVLPSEAAEIHQLSGSSK